MNRKHTLLKSIIAGLMAMSIALPAWAQEAEYKIDVSLETGPNHIRNISVRNWAEQVNEGSDGRLRINVFEGAAKFKGSAVATALAQRTLDMGVPGTWHLTKFDPDFGVIFLPMFFGRDRQVTYDVMDGKVGQELVANIESKLGVKVIGRFIDIGGAITFMKTAPITSLEDYEDKRIRIAGSAAHSRRYEALGANAVNVSWTDVPQALQTGMVDGVMTAFESVRSASLWDSGIRYAFVDQHAFHQYVPMINRDAWEGLPADLRSLVIDTWEANVDSQREFTAERDVEARSISIEHGIEVTDPTPEEIDALRARLMPIQADVVSELRMDPDFVARVQTAIEAATQ